MGYKAARHRRTHSCPLLTGLIVLIGYTLQSVFILTIGEGEGQKGQQGQHAAGPHLCLRASARCSTHRGE